VGRSRYAIGYVRTSELENDDPLVAVESQRKAIEDYASFCQLNLEAVLVDEGVPGGVPLDARPAGAEFARWIHKPRVHSVLTWRLDRLFASARECLAAVSRWEEKEIALHVLDLAGNPVETFSPHGRYVLSLLRSVAHMEDLQREATANLRYLHKRKKGAKLLLGEKVVRGYVVPDPVEAHAVQRIQELAGQGKSLRLIAEALDQEGVPTKRRAKAWSKEAIRLILRRIENNEIRSLRDESATGLSAGG
jgi:site-specific DNA recombinase